MSSKMKVAFKNHCKYKDFNQFAIYQKETYKI